MGLGDSPAGKDGRLSPEPVLGDSDSCHLRTPSPARHLRTPIILTEGPAENPVGGHAEGTGEVEEPVNDPGSRRREVQTGRCWVSCPQRMWEGWPQ